MIIDLQNAGKYFGAEQILTEINFKIEDTDRIGLIGSNGAGKTTLLNLITGKLTADEGEVIRSNKTIGYLEQNSGLTGGKTILNEMREVFSDLFDIEKQLKDLYNDMSATNPDSEDYRILASKYARLQTVFEQKDGYNIDVKINTVLNGMGFLNKDRSIIVDTLSGGEKTRLAICKLLLTAPDLLILDEPTNHLDFKTLMWLEEYLSTYKGALLMVSHDRYFLDKCVDSIAEIYKGKLKRYKGNYTKFRHLKEEELKFLTKEYEKQQNEISSLKTYVEKNIVRASTSKSAQSRQKILDKMEVMEKPTEYLKTVSLSFEYDIEPVKDVLTVDDLKLEIGGNLLADHLCLDVKRGEKIAIVGENGVGKTSLLKALMNKFVYSQGSILWGRNTKISYFEQETTELNENNNLIGEISDAYPMMYEQEIRNILGRMRLTGEDVYKKVGNLSGGEKAKLKFAKIMLRRGNVLIFDEPTNHLDLPSKDNLDEALFDYTGTLITVSHDRYLLNKVPDKIIELGKDGLTVYNGKYDDYLRQKEQEKQKSEPIPVVKKEDKENSYYRSKKDRANEIKAKKEAERIEKEILETEELIETLQNEIANPEIASDYELLNEKCKQIEENQDKLLNLYEQWDNYN